LTSQIRFRQKVLKQVPRDKKLFQVSEKGKAHSVEKLKSNVLQLIMDAATGPVEKVSQNQIPLLVGEKVKYTFNEGSWPGRVLRLLV